MKIKNEQAKIACIEAEKGMLQKLLGTGSNAPMSLAFIVIMCSFVAMFLMPEHLENLYP